MAPRRQSGKSTQQFTEKSTQQFAEELQLLEDQNYARLKCRMDQFERSMDLAILQINSRVAAEPPPNGPTLADLHDKLSQLQENASNNQPANFSEFETKSREILHHMELEMGKIKTELGSQCQEMLRRMEVELENKKKEVESKCQETLDRMKVDLAEKNSKLEFKCQEVLGRMEVEQQKHGQLAISSSIHNPLDVARDAILALQTNIDSIQGVIRTSEEVAMEKQKELLEQQAEINRLQNLGTQLFEEIVILKKSSTQNQTKLAGQASQINALLQGGQSVTRRQDEVDVQLRTVKEIVTNLSGPKQPMVESTVQRQSMEVDVAATESGAYSADTANLMESVTDKCNEVAETQHRNLSAAVESLKEWVLSAVKRELQSISGEIEKQRHELECLKHVKPQLERISQQQTDLFGKLAPMENINLQLVKENGENQTMDVGEAEKITSLVKRQCDESLSVIQHSLNTGLESLKQSLLVTQSKELQPIIKQTTSASTELIQLRRQLQSMLDVKAEIEKKILGLEDANRTNQASYSKADSDIRSLIAENQRLCKFQTEIAHDVSELSKEWKEVQLGNTNMQNEYVELERPSIIELARQTCNQSLEIYQRNFNAGLESFKEGVLSAQNKELQPIFEQAKQTSSELSKQSRQLETMAGAKAQIEGKVSSLEKASKTTQSTLAKAEANIQSLIGRTDTLGDNLANIQDDSVQVDATEFWALAGEVEHLRKTFLEVSRFMDMQTTNSRTGNTCPPLIPDLPIVGCQSSPQTSSPILIDMDNILAAEEDCFEPERARPKLCHRSVAEDELDPDLDEADDESSKQECSASKKARSNVCRRRGIEDESNADSDHDDESNKRRDISGRPLSNRSNSKARSNLRRNYIDEEYDTSPASNNRTTSKGPGGLTKNQKWRRKTGKDKAVKPRRESLRKERASMEPSEKDDDITLSNAVHTHIRILAGLPRRKSAFLPEPTIKNLDKLPPLPPGPLSVSGGYLVTKATKSWDPEDEMGDGFSEYCLRRIKQYGLPFFGLSTFLDNPKAVEWNHRAAAFCSDTFYYAVQSNDYGKIFRAGYDIHNGGLERAKELIQLNLDYRIAEMTKELKRAKSNPYLVTLPDSTDRPNNSQEGKSKAVKLRAADAQKDWRFQRRKDLAKRRYSTASAIPDLRIYRHLFEDEHLCSSDESVPGSDDDKRIRHAPVWRSSKATALVERIDKQTKMIRADGPSKAGRKPGKRIDRGAEAPPGGLYASPRRLPEDCYGTLWLQSQSAENRKELQVASATFNE